MELGTSKRVKITGTISLENSKNLKNIFLAEKENGETLSSILDACLDISLDDVREWLRHKKMIKEDLIKSFKEGKVSQIKKEEEQILA